MRHGFVTAAELAAGHAPGAGRARRSGCSAPAEVAGGDRRAATPCDRDPAGAPAFAPGDAGAHAW